MQNWLDKVMGIFREFVAKKLWGELTIKFRDGHVTEVRKTETLTE